jgi:hypothetical protein
MERGLEGDPLNLLYRALYARGLRLAGRMEYAEAELRKILEIDQENQHALGRLPRRISGVWPSTCPQCRIQWDVRDWK